MHNHVEQYRTLFERIRGLRDFHPSPEVNAAFGALVRFAQTPVADNELDHLLSDPFVQATLGTLQQYALQAETCLEYHWAEQLAGGDPERMRAFPYFQNYALLINQEIACLRMFLPDPKRVLFVGAGPMPISPLLLQQGLQAKVTCMDISMKACAYHEHFTDHPALQSECSDICTVQDLSGYDVIMLAALVGESEAQKLEILRHLFAHMLPGQILLLRNSEGMKKILYPAVECSKVQALGRNTLLLHFAPQNEVINATSLFRRV